MLINASWIKTKVPHHQSAPTTKGFILSSLQGSVSFSDSTQFCHQCLYCCSWICWKWVKFACSKELKPIRSSNPKEPIFELSSALLRWYQDLLYSKQLYWWKSTFYWNDELRNYWQDLVTSFVKKIIGSKNCKWSVWVIFLSCSVEEYRKVVMIVKRFDWYFPD